MRRGDGCVYKEIVTRSLLVMEKIRFLIVVIDTQIYRCDKTPQSYAYAHTSACRIGNI